MALKTGTVESSFWTGATGRALTKKPDAQRLALYLITAPSADACGLYRLSLETAANDIGLSLDACRKAMAVLVEIGFAKYDESACWVWVVEMLRFQLGPTMKCGDKRIGVIQRTVDAAVGKPFVAEFVNRYESTHCIHAPPRMIRLPEPAKQPEPVPAAEEPAPERLTPKQSQRRDDILAVIAHYQTFHPAFGKKLNKEKPEWRSINARLDDGYTVDELKIAITAMCNDEWYQQKGLDTLHMAVRQSAKVDEFLGKAQQKKRPVLNQKNRRGQDAAQALLAMEFGELTEDEANSLEVK